MIALDWEVAVLKWGGRYRLRVYARRGGHVLRRYVPDPDITYERRHLAELAQVIMLAAILDRGGINDEQDLLRRTGVTRADQAEPQRPEGTRGRNRPAADRRAAAPTDG